MRVRKEMAWGRRGRGGLGRGSVMSLAGPGKQWKKGGWSRDPGGHWRFPESSPGKGSPDRPAQTQCTTRQGLRLGAARGESKKRLVITA